MLNSFWFTRFGFPPFPSEEQWNEVQQKVREKSALTICGIQRVADGDQPTSFAVNPYLRSNLTKLMGSDLFFDLPLVNIDLG